MRRSDGAAVETREYRPDDLAACLAVFDSNVPRFFRPPERDEYRDFLASLPGPYLVLADEYGEMAACGGYAPEGSGVVSLCWGMVRRGLHGSGLGRALTEARISRAVADPQVERVVLSTSQLTSGFYERLGFKILAVDPDGFGPGLDRCDMRLDLERGGETHAGHLSFLEAESALAELKIDVESGVAVFEPTGTMTVQRLKDLITEMLEHPNFVRCMPSLWDMTDCDLSELDASGMRVLAAFNNERREERGRTRVALVTATELDFGILRQYEANVDVPTTSTRTFRDRAAAERWVKDG